MPADDDPQPSTDDEPLTLNYAGPRLRPRWAGVGLWKVFCRIVGGMMVVMLCSGYFVSLLAIPGEIRIVIIGIAGVVAVAFFIWWGRSPTVWEPEWDTGKDRRATTWRRSTSRYDSSGVMIVDPHSPGKPPEE